MGSSSLLPDFDTLVALHREDPDAFEELRRQLLNDAIAAAPLHHRPQLEKVLERIEEARNASTSPMESAISASRLMQESLGSLMVAWKKAQYKIAGLQTSLLIEKYRLGG
jgi:formate dehydrogenase maturation protein FdhE